MIASTLKPDVVVAEKAYIICPWPGIGQRYKAVFDGLSVPESEHGERQRSGAVKREVNFRPVPETALDEFTYDRPFDSLSSVITFNTGAAFAWQRRR